jgi:hypothetical protein
MAYALNNDDRLIINCVAGLQTLIVFSDCNPEKPWVLAFVTVTNYTRYFPLAIYLFPDVKEFVRAA